MLSHAFLKTINRALDPHGDTEELTDAEKAKAAVAAASKRPNKTEVTNNRHGLELLSVLGLMYAQLSKQTMKELCVRCCIFYYLISHPLKTIILIRNDLPQNYSILH